MPHKSVILAFDTAAAHCAAVVVQGQHIRAERIEPMQKGQAERLFPLIEELLSEADKSWNSLAAIAVGTGPGNFTGIRISISAARGLALSLGIPAIGISRMEAIAFGTRGTKTALIGAPRQQTYHQSFENGIVTGSIGLSHIANMSDASPISDAPLDLPNVQLVSSETLLRNMACLAGIRIAQDNPRPAPLYVRAPDAAVSTDPPPGIVP